MANTQDTDFVRTLPGEQIVPITVLSEENIRAIPHGSEVVIFNMQEGSIEAGIWGPEMVDRFLHYLKMYGQADMESVLTLLQVPVLDTPEDVVKATLSDWSLDPESRPDLGDVPRNYSIPPQQFRDILLDVAQRAQRQKKYEPEKES